MTETPTPAIHVVPLRWRMLGLLGTGVLTLMLAFGLALPGMLPSATPPVVVWVGFIVAAPPLCLLVLRLANPAAGRLETTREGLVAHRRGRTRLILWDAVVGVRDRPVLDRIELQMADGSVVRLSHRIEGLAVLLARALERVAPSIPHDYHGSPWLPALSLLGIAAVPASALLAGGILMVAWLAAAAGLGWLLLGMRKVRLGAAMLRIDRPIGRRLVPLRAIVATRLALGGLANGRNRVELLTAEDEVVEVTLPIGRLYLFYAALVRQLRAVHGPSFGAWPEPAGPADVRANEDALIREAIDDFETATPSRG